MFSLRNFSKWIRTSKKFGVLVFWVAPLVLLGCMNSGKPSGSSGSDEASPQAQLLQTGRATYFSTCIACHNQNPKFMGSVGPALAGSSKALLEAKVLKGTYPPDYKPKRATKLMVAMPQMKDKIEALHAFLAGS
jgi:mono/diheme cytochrome c family protein